MNLSKYILCHLWCRSFTVFGWSMYYFFYIYWTEIQTFPKMWYCKALCTGLYIINTLFHISSTMEPQCCSQVNRQLSTILLWTNTNSTPCDVTLHDSGMVVLPGTPMISAPPWHHCSGIYISTSTMSLRLPSIEGIGGCHNSHTSHAILKLWG